METFLDLPERPAKPRKKGLTLLLDNGLATGYFADVLHSHAELVDGVKFGWGTTLATREIEKKIAILNDAGIYFYFGGTLFEKALVQGKLDGFRRYCKDMGATHVEISDGTIDIPLDARKRYVESFAKDFTVFTEVGHKDPDKSEALPPSKWLALIRGDLESGAAYVITEARESGTSGICRPDGRPRFGLIEEIRVSGIDTNKIVFEAPNKTLQVHFLRTFGHNANLGNIAFGDVVGLETLRLGLRSDTLLDHEKKA